MSGPGVEHRTEIRRANRTTPIWIALAVSGAAVALAVGTGDGGDVDDASIDGATTVPVTPTSETLTTTSPRDLVPVHGLTQTQRGILPFSTAVTPMADSAWAEPDDIELAGQPIVTGELVVVLERTQTLRVGEPGGSFRFAGCCWDEIHPSNEPGHVWGRTGEQVMLVDPDAGEPPGGVVLDVGGEQVLGPASFGVVTVDDRNVVRWHRPSFEPTVVSLPDDRRAVDSGGEHVLVTAPATSEHPARLEAWSIVGDGLIGSHDVPGESSATGIIAPDGSAVLVPTPSGWEVRDVATGALRGTLPEVTEPVWTGGTRFAAAVDEQLVVSDSGLLPLRWPVLAVAEQSP